MSSLIGTESPKGSDKAVQPPAQAPCSPPVQPNSEAMNAEPLRRNVVITNPLGFHMRPMSAFVKVASKFQCKLSVCGPDGQRVDGRSILSLMALAAEQGTELILEAEGPDQAEALEALVALMNNIPEQEGEAPA
jgi:phosphocarrier protein HPr